MKHRSSETLGTFEQNLQKSKQLSPCFSDRFRDKLKEMCRREKTLLNPRGLCVTRAGVCAVNGLLYVVGGDDGSCNLSSVEFYNPVADRWSLIPTNMSNGRSYAGKMTTDAPARGGGGELNRRAAYRFLCPAVNSSRLQVSR